MEDWLTRLVALEAEIAYKSAPAVGERYFRYVPGRLPILLSAPHGAAHVREGRLKDEEDYTSALARLVASLTGAHALYTRYLADPDPGYYCNTPYKRALRQIVSRHAIGFVIDLHGCAAYRDFGLALGTLHGKSCPDQRPLILEILHRHGFRESGPWLSVVDVDRTFTANGRQGQETITRFACQRLGIPAVQIEIHPHLRVVRRLSEASEREPYEGEPENVLRTVRLLIALVESLAKHLTGRQPHSSPALESPFSAEDEGEVTGKED